MEFEDDGFCPSCDKVPLIEFAKSKNNLTLLYCVECARCYWSQSNKLIEISEEAKVDQRTRIPVSYPEINTGTKVYINSAEHELSLSHGIVVNKDHKHYRIRITDENSKLHNKLIWLPEHWVSEIPQSI